MRSAPLRRVSCALAVIAVGSCAGQPGRVVSAAETRQLCPPPRTPVASVATRPPVASIATHLDDGAWSYFGDPRALARGDRVIIGCVSRRGQIVVHQYDRSTGRTARAVVHRNPEVDDHDNPSLVLWRTRVWAFFSPHSGRKYPLNRISEMHYRVSRRAYDIRGGFGRERHVRTNTPGGLGYTYPNPVVAGAKLWLFWRGGNWYPTVSWTADGVRWAPARTLVVGPPGQRPYAKYVGGGDGSMHIVMSDAHPQSGRTSLYYVRYKRQRFYRANGTRVAHIRDLPLRLSRLDRVYRFNAARGRAWPHDIALDRHGRPVVLYTGRVGGPGGDDTFLQARWTGRGWRHDKIAAAGRGTVTFHSGGGSFDHADPTRVVLSRRVGKWFRVELWRTPNQGRDWLAPVPISTPARAHSFRPVIPRGRTDGTHLVVAYVQGKARSFRSFQTDIELAELDTL